MLSFIFSFLVLFGFWMIFSGHFHLLTNVLGIISSLIVAFFTNRLFFPDKKVNFKLIAKIFLYVPFLMKEIILSNIEILKILLKKDVKQEIDPIMLEFEPEVKSDIGITLLGNSITLTPGTVTIFAQKDKFLVHAISPDFKDGIFALQNKVKKIEEAL